MQHRPCRSSPLQVRVGRRHFLRRRENPGAGRPRPQSDSTASSSGLSIGKAGRNLVGEPGKIDARSGRMIESRPVARIDLKHLWLVRLRPFHRKSISATPFHLWRSNQRARCRHERLGVDRFARLRPAPALIGNCDKIAVADRAQHLPANGNEREAIVMSFDDFLQQDGLLRRRMGEIAASDLRALQLVHAAPANTIDRLCDDGRASHSRGLLPVFKGAMMRVTGPGKTCSARNRAKWSLGSTMRIESHPAPQP